MQFLKLYTAASAVLTAFAALPAMPVSAEGETSAETVIEPLYEPDQPYAAGLHLTLTEDRACTLRVFQHSPEAEALLICEETLPAKAGGYVLSLEPGQYTCAVSASALSDGFAPLTAEQDFTVENPDFSEKTDYTDYNLTVTFSQIGSDETPDAAAAALKSALKNRRKTLTQTVTFGHYENRLAGDYDGDGAVTAYDATMVLCDFNFRMIGLENDPPATAEQRYACDIDGDGAITAYDATMILQYFTLKTSGFDPDWDMVLNKA